MFLSSGGRGGSDPGLPLHSDSSAHRGDQRRLCGGHTTQGTVQPAKPNHHLKLRLITVLELELVLKSGLPSRCASLMHLRTAFYPAVLQL